MDLISNSEGLLHKLYKINKEKQQLEKKDKFKNLNRCLVIQLYQSQFFYTIQNEIGQSKAHFVYQVKQQQNQQIRVMRKEKNFLLNKKNYSSIFKIFNHPNLLKIYQINSNENYIITEQCCGRNLQQKLYYSRPFFEKQVAKIIKQLLSALNFIHRKNIIHSNITLDNIFYSSNDENSILIKLIGFQSSIILKENQALYNNLIEQQSQNNDTNTNYDIYSCGIILYTLLCGYPPSSEKFNLIQLDNYQNKIPINHEYFIHFNSIEWDLVSQEAKNLVLKLLNCDSTKYISAYEALQDPWIKKYGNSNFLNINAKQILTNIQNYQKQELVQQGLFQFIVHELISTEVLNEMAEHFILFDLDGDGYLSQRELIYWYSKIVTNMEAILIVEKLFQKLSKENDDSINYQEFIILAIDKKTFLTVNKLQIAFKMLDIDNDGQISLNDLQYHFYGMNNNIQCEIQELLDDQVWDINFDVFQNILLNIQ